MSLQQLQSIIKDIRNQDSHKNHIHAIREIEHLMMGPRGMTGEQKLGNRAPEVAVYTPLDSYTLTVYGKKRKSREQLLRERLTYPVCPERAERLLQTTPLTELSWLYAPDATYKSRRHRTIGRVRKEGDDILKPSYLYYYNGLRTFQIIVGREENSKSFFINLNYYAKISKYFKVVEEKFKDGSMIELLLPQERPNEMHYFFSVTSPVVSGDDDQRICYKKILPLLRFSSMFQMQKLYLSCVTYLFNFNGWAMMSTDWILDVMVLIMDIGKSDRVMPIALRNLLDETRKEDLEILTDLEKDRGILTLLEDIQNGGKSIRHNLVSSPEDPSVMMCSDCNETNLSADPVDVCLVRFYIFASARLWPESGEELTTQVGEAEKGVKQEKASRVESVEQIKKRNKILSARLNRRAAAVSIL